MRILTFRYNLDKSSKKYICPNCTKKTFVRYVDIETGNFLNGNYGRCDRESKCNYHNAPPTGKKCYLINFLSIKSISDKAYKATDNNGHINIIPKSQILERNGNSSWVSEWFLKKNSIAYLGNESKYFTPDEKIVNTVATVATFKSEPEKSSYHNLELLDGMYNDQPIRDNLKIYLKSIFTDAQVFTAMQSYFLTGTNRYWKNATVFWQIDHKENIHAGKIMLYNPSTGKRIKEPYNHINWIHKALKKQDFNLNQCFFGLHRINEDYIKPIAIVESEKTAIIMSIIIPDVVWLATGSKQNLKAELVRPLIGRKIILYPDKGEYSDWKRKGILLKGSGFKIEVSDFLELTTIKEGSDLADYNLGRKNK